MVDAGQYFTINRARQYGKTTTLTALRGFLSPQYEVISLDFQGMGDASFSTEQEFVQGFLDFLSQLREGYISRETDGILTFKSVILAGVTDVKNLKRKLRPEEMHKFNSPWNIATDFKADMSLGIEGIEGIAGMSDEYEADHHTGMDINKISGIIYDYTSGYPYLVSRICKFLDTELVVRQEYSKQRRNQVKSRFETLKEAWTEEGISEAVRVILLGENTLFDSLMSKVNSNNELSSVLQRILFSGEIIAYNPYDVSLSDAKMYGFIINDNGTVKVANRIFETLLYNFYLTTEDMQNTLIYKTGTREKDSFVSKGRLDMDYVLERFVSCYDEIYQSNHNRFDESEQVFVFLLEAEFSLIV